MTIKTRTPAKRASKSSTKSAARQPDVATEQPQADQPMPAATGQAVELPGLEQPVTGRGVFAVRTLGQAVSVESAFLAENGEVLRLPAVFPDRQYALEQIDELRALVVRHFDDLAQQAKPKA